MHNKRIRLHRRSRHGSGTYMSFGFKCSHLDIKQLRLDRLHAKSQQRQPAIIIQVCPQYPSSVSKLYIMLSQSIVIIPTRLPQSRTSHVNHQLILLKLTSMIHNDLRTSVFAVNRPIEMQSTASALFVSIVKILRNGSWRPEMQRIG
jgi:hypothetical protein